MADPQAPNLPANVPKGLRDFIECRERSVDLKDGPVDWVDLPPEIAAILPKGTKPKLSIIPGSAPGTATIKVSLAFISIELPAAISNGVLSIDTSDVSSLVPKEAIAGLKKFVDDLNAWLKFKGYGLGPLTFANGGVTLRKVPLAPPATTNPPAPAVIVPPPPPPPPTPPAKPEPPPEPYYEPKYVTPPPLPNKELFPPKDGPSASAGSGAGMGSVGGPTGGPGAKATTGLGGVGLRALVAVVILAVLGIGGFALLGGGGQPVPATLPPSSLPTIGPTPVATVAETTQPSTVPSAAAPSIAGVINGRFEVLDDTRVDSCHHTYTIGFRVFDSNGNADALVGKTATFQVLEGQSMTTTIGAGGTWQVTVKEAFVKTNSGCHSMLTPEVISVDGQPVF